MALISPSGKAIAIEFCRVNPDNMAVLPLLWSGDSFETVGTGAKVTVERVLQS